MILMIRYFVKNVRKIFDYMIMYMKIYKMYKLGIIWLLV